MSSILNTSYKPRNEPNPFRPIIERGQRLAAIGHTGTGKTTLVMQLLDKVVPPRVPVVCIDPKSQLEPPSDSRHMWDYAETLPPNWERQVMRRKAPEYLRLIVRPYLSIYPDRKTTFEPLNELYRRLFAHAQRQYGKGNRRFACILYLDDLQELCDGNRAHASLQRIVQTGRALGLMQWGSTLRPRAVPRYFFSEADHLFVFRLVDEDDRDRAAEFVGKVAKEVPGPGAHDFFYRSPDVAEMDPLLVHQQEH